LHGDIVDRNVLLHRVGDRRKLMLTDLGDIAPEYNGDASALADLFRWCIEHVPRLKGDRDAQIRVGKAEQQLRNEGNFENALELMAAGT